MMSMQTGKPRVSVGIPVYNGEDFLSFALDSVLAQTFRDFELLICDNASTDRTPQICLAYASREARIRYFRNEKNLGIAMNQNRLSRLATGEYFAWVAHDDGCAPEYLARCVEILDQNPDVVVCYSKTQDIGEDGLPIGRDNPHRVNEVPSEKLASDSLFLRQRFHDLIQLNHQCEPDYGLIRMEVLKKTGLHGRYADSDRVLLAELALHGRFHYVREPLFLHREHTHRSVHAYPSRQRRTVLMDPTQEGKIVLPYWREFFEFLRCIGRAPISRRVRMSCYSEMLGWLKDYRLKLLSDVKVALQDTARKILPGAVQRAIKRVLAGPQPKL